MTEKNPTAELQPDFSSDNAEAASWETAREKLEKADIYWLATMRPDGRPHVTPLIALWLDDTFYFTTGPEERKAKNIAENANCVVTTGCNTFEDIDLVVEGAAAQLSDETTLQRVADEIAAKYEGWHFEVRDGAFHVDGRRSLVFQVAPTTAFGFTKSEPFSQTRWRF